ncbi:helix-turn-helix domain-containing protein [Kingella oralis]|uniref:helix-turn-helix domain-containing protein n=1 Tax=Kingella oralis TaxID=505 RepID=UPI0034E5C56D
MNSETYNVAQAATYLKCHPETVREMIRSGKLVAAKIGRSYCIRKIYLDALIASNENETVQALARSRSRQQCPSINEKAVSGTLTFGHRAAAELDNLLARKTNRKHKGCTIN